MAKAKKIRKYTIGYVYLPWTNEDDIWTETFDSFGWDKASAIRLFESYIQSGALNDSERIEDYSVQFVH